MTDTTIDFRNGSSWGRALHGSTFRRAKAEGLIDRIKDRIQGAYRASVMVHYPRPPVIGDKVVWEAKSGTVTATVYEVARCRDPDDMYTLFVRIIPGRR